MGKSQTNVHYVDFKKDIDVEILPEKLASANKTRKIPEVKYVSNVKNSKKNSRNSVRAFFTKNEQ